MDAQLKAPLSSLETKLNDLITAITSSATASGAPTAAVALLEADDGLSKALQTLRTHQSNYAKILRLRAEAEDLEERVKGIVREVVSMGDEISAATRGVDGQDSDSEDESADGDIDTEMTGVSGEEGGRRKKEVDYKLLLDFARRISRYNTQAAADATSHAQAKLAESKQKEDDGSAPGGQSGVGVAALSKETVNWLDETATWTRNASKLPFPSEEHIRMGLMGQLHAAAAEGKDPEKEIERMIMAAEGRLDAGGIESGGSIPEGHFEPGAEPGVPGGHGGTHGGTAQAKPKAKLDLDLYDPDDEED